MNKDSTAYAIGTWTGTVLNIALSFVNPCNLASGFNFVLNPMAGKWLPGA